MAEKAWQRKFEDPIILPDGIRLNTLREAIAYLVKAVPASESDMPAVTTAAEMLTNAAEKSDVAWMMFARMATLQVIHRNEVRVFNPDRKDAHWARRKLKRDRL
jgi:hypothetical protein